ncbi:hypothetical protein BU15DRAFT_76396 [Melanogaster broomeanus]|nr:hypothetical protein BU15DRAFT_76396 [Melanogaster broomeanus]
MASLSYLQPYPYPVPAHGKAMQLDISSRYATPSSCSMAGGKGRSASTTPSERGSSKDVLPVGMDSPRLLQFFQIDKAATSRAFTPSTPTKPCKVSALGLLFPNQCRCVRGILLEMELYRINSSSGGISLLLADFGGATVQDEHERSALTSVIPAEYLPDEVRVLRDPAELVIIFIEFLAAALMSHTIRYLDE